MPAVRDATVGSIPKSESWAEDVLRRLPEHHRGCSASGQSEVIQNGGRCVRRERLGQVASDRMDISLGRIGTSPGIVSRFRLTVWCV